ncbi:MAG: pilin [Candidatus Paceibacterota bacterium]|jgi:hypothetical protein
MKKILIAAIISVILGSILIPSIVAFAGDICQEVAPPKGQKLSDVENLPAGENKCWSGQRVEACCPKEGLVGCGVACCRCTLCDFFSLIDRLIDFLIFKLAPIAAILLIIVGGVMFMISSGDPGKVTKAKGIIVSVIIGLVIMYSSYMIVGFILKSIGLASWAYGDASGGLFDSFINDGVFKIDCSRGSSGPGDGSGGSGGGLGIDVYCAGKTWSPINNCLAAYGNEDNKWFSYCVSNPCGVNMPKGCEIFEGFPGVKTHCRNKL